MVGWVQAGVLAFATSGLLSAAFQRTQLSERLAAQARAEALAANEQLVEELREALANVKALSGMLPICAWCHKVRNDEGYWEQIEAYISARSEAEFSHALCPDCYARHFAER
jgi:cytochrome c553